MPQMILPMIPERATQISDLVSVWRGNQTWTYFLGTHPINSHPVGDQRMFRIVTSQLIESGACQPIHIIKTFGVSKSSVDRALRKYRAGGIEAFFKKPPGRKGGTILTNEVLTKAQLLFDQGVHKKRRCRRAWREVRYPEKSHK